MGAYTPTGTHKSKEDKRMTEVELLEEILKKLTSINNHLQNITEEDD